MLSLNMLIVKGYWILSTVLCLRPRKQSRQSSCSHGAFILLGREITSMYMKCHQLVMYYEGKKSRVRILNRVAREGRQAFYF